jgi:hypothetical protein
MVEKAGREGNGGLQLTASMVGERAGIPTTSWGGSDERKRTEREVDWNTKRLNRSILCYSGRW